MAILAAGAFPLRALPDNASFEDAWPDYAYVAAVSIDGPVDISIKAMRPYLTITGARPSLTITASRPTLTITET